MAIEKRMEPFDLDIEDTDAEEIEIEIINPEAVSIDTDDGGVIIDFDGGITEEILGTDHDANLAHRRAAIELADTVGGSRCMPMPDAPSPTMRCSNPGTASAPLSPGHQCGCSTGTRTAAQYGVAAADAAASTRRA